MKLVELNPKWITYQGRIGVGIRFDDPKVKCMVLILFANPLDGGPPLPNNAIIPGNNGGTRWLRNGDDFNTLTISPSINGEPGASHFNVSDGNITF